MDIDVSNVTKLWLSLSEIPREVYYNFDKDKITFDYDIPDNCELIGVYRSDVSLTDFLGDIRVIVKEEHY